MKKAATYFVISIAISVFFSSCVAFHSGFPFICFSKSCAKNQWKAPRAAIKKIKKKYSKSKFEKRKKKAAASSSKSGKPKASNSDIHKNPEYDIYDSSEIATILKQQLNDFSTCITKKDSITILFSTDDDVISEAYKDSLSKFFHKLTINNISCITLKGYCDSTETDNRAFNLGFNRALTAFHFISSLGIPSNKIAIKNTNGIQFRQDQSHDKEDKITSLKKTEISVYW